MMRLILRQYWVFGLVLALSSLVLAGCGPQQENPTPTISLPPGHGQIPPSYEHVPRITPQELVARLDAGEDIVLVDARKENGYLKEHAEGALSLPVDEINDRYEELPKDKDIVFYCT